MNRHLVLFVKAPRRGQVKTRLAAGIGAGAAVAFYRRQTAAAVRRLGGDRRWRLWLAVAAARDRTAGFWPAQLPRIDQGRGDLGRRMLQPFRCLPPGPVAVVGSDIPGITPRHLADAFRLLAAHQVVFGPAADGGYWLVAARRWPLPRHMFDDVRWSTRHALADTLANLAGWRVGLAATLADVDTAADYQAWRTVEQRLSRPCGARVP